MGSKVDKTEKRFKAEITITRQEARFKEDTYDHSRTEVGFDSEELTNLTIKASTLENLIDKINSHTELVSED